jgi:hypothetical protein
VSEAQPAGGTHGGDPVVPGVIRTIRATAGGRRALMLVVALVLISVIIVVGLVLFSSMARKSQSYKDGFSVGGNVYAADATAQLGARAACTKTERKAPLQGGLPVGDSPTQWITGCVAAFESAQGGN